MGAATRRLKDGGQYRRRHYRKIAGGSLNCEFVTVEETDLAVYSSNTAIAPLAKEIIMRERGYIEAYIRRFPNFASTLSPCTVDPTAPSIVREMIHASALSSVGPMAAVAGAIAERVGIKLLDTVNEVIVENGGDIFIHTRQKVKVGLFAGQSPLSMKVGLELDAVHMPQGVCTSSGRVGHSLSFGSADAVCIISSSCALADAAATAVANHVSRPGDIQKAIDWGKRISGVDGIVIIIDEQLGAWGQVKIIPL